jgi:hypothetical protein
VTIICIELISQKVISPPAATYIQNINLCMMGTIKFVSRISNSPDLVVFGSTHPTPLFSTTNWSRGTLDMITAFQFLNPPAADTGLGIHFKPSSGELISGELVNAHDVPVLRASNSRVSGGATVETGFELADRTSEMRRHF